MILSSRPPSLEAPEPLINRLSKFLPSLVSPRQALTQNESSQSSEASLKSIHYRQFIVMYLLSVDTVMGQQLLINTGGELSTQAFRPVACNNEAPLLKDTQRHSETKYGTRRPERRRTSGKLKVCRDTDDSGVRWSMCATMNGSDLRRGGRSGRRHLDHPADAISRPTVRSSASHIGHQSGSPNPGPTGLG